MVNKISPTSAATTTSSAISSAIFSFNSRLPKRPSAPSSSTSMATVSKPSANRLAFTSITMPTNSRKPPAGSARTMAYWCGTEITTAASTMGANCSVITRYSPAAVKQQMALPPWQNSIPIATIKSIAATPPLRNSACGKTPTAMQSSPMTSFYRLTHWACKVLT